MALRSAAEEMDRLQLSDEDTEDLWNSPSQRAPKYSHPSPHPPSTTPPPRSSHDADTLFDQQESREAALRNELQSVRNINQVIESLLTSLDHAKGNMDVCHSSPIMFYPPPHSPQYNGFRSSNLQSSLEQNVSRTVDSASTLLNTWTRILSQTEHNQRLILNPNWQGAVQDVADMENEELLKQQAAERRERELQQQREAAARRAEEEERKRALVAGTRGTRGTTRGRVVRSTGLGRTPSVSYSGTSGSSRTTTSTATRGSSTTTTRRPVSGIARGPGATRGRDRT